LIDEIDARWPNRSTLSDGTKGDDRHAATKSDHNPNLLGIVRARDITAAGIDATWLIEHLRMLGAAGDPRLYPGGYLIHRSRITTPDFRSWRAYHGSNPHDSHVHVSFALAQAGYDSTKGWGIWPTADTPIPQALPVLRYGDRSDQVRRLQQFLTRAFPSYAQFEPTGFYGDQTKAAVREFQRRAGVHGSPLDGSIVGPATNYALARHGYRG
jgi:hypothetical protein